MLALCSQKWVTHHSGSICVKVLVVDGNCRESDQSPPPFYPQVNSDVVFYSRGKDGTMQPVRVNQTHVGRMVLTKAAGATTRRDITSQYKFPEGLSVPPKLYKDWPGMYWKHTCLLLISVLQISNLGTNEERTVLEKAEGFGCHREKSRPAEADVDLVLPTLEAAIGDDFELSLEFKNRSDQRRVVEAYISGNVVYYTGVSNAEFMLREPTVTMEPNESGRSLLSFFSNKILIRCIMVNNTVVLLSCLQMWKSRSWLSLRSTWSTWWNKPTFILSSPERSRRPGRSSPPWKWSLCTIPNSALRSAIVLSFGSFLWFPGFGLHTLHVVHLGGYFRCLAQTEWAKRWWWPWSSPTPSPSPWQKSTSAWKELGSCCPNSNITGELHFLYCNPQWQFQDLNCVVAGFSLIPKSSSLTWTEFFVPKRAGATRVFATLDCPALRQVQGEASLTIEPWGTPAEYRLVQRWAN